ncbi:MAG: hypothetical protein Phyf2KO_01920 [Phycisphaerales bacterium]
MSESPNREVSSLSLEAALYDSGTGRFTTHTGTDKAGSQQGQQTQAKSNKIEQDKG